MVLFEITPEMGEAFEKELAQYHQYAGIIDKLVNQPPYPVDEMIKDFNSLPVELQTHEICTSMLSMDVKFMEHITNQSIEVCRWGFMYCHPITYTYIREQTPEIRAEFIRYLRHEDVGYIKLLGELTEDEIKGILDRFHDGLEYIDKGLIDEDMCILAMRSNRNSFRSIPEEFRTKKMTEHAIKAAAGNILAFKGDEQTTKYKRMAIDSMYGGDSILRLLDNVSEGDENYSIKKHPQSIQYIDSPTEKQQILAVKGSTTTLYHIKNPSDAAVIAAIKIDGRSIDYVKLPTLPVVIAALNKAHYWVEHIGAFTTETANYVVDADPTNIRHLPSQFITDEMAVKVIMIDPANIAYIRNPTRLMLIQAHYGLKVRNINQSIITELILNKANSEGM